MTHGSVWMIKYRFLISISNNFNQALVLKINGPSLGWRTPENLVVEIQRFSMNTTISF